MMLSTLISVENHTVVQSSFEKPCVPLPAHEPRIFSGFNFATAQGESKSVFTFQVNDTKPFWYYCSQPVGDHCSKGMSGVINQNFDSVKTLTKYKENSKGVIAVQPDADSLKYQGGWIQTNMPL
jgi:hypothetical protein